MKLREFFAIAVQRLAHRLFSLLPVQDDVVFLESFIGLSYACNPRYIYEQMLRQGLPLRCVWSMQDTSQQLPGNPGIVRRFSLSYSYHLATARYLISNTEFARNLPLRKSQVYLNTQHGTPLKKMGRHQPNDKSNRKSKTGRWTYLLTQNHYATEIFRDAYEFEGEVLEYGHPRNDLFYQRNTPGQIRAAKERLGLPVDTRVVLYAPTWRTGQATLPLDTSKLAGTLGAGYTLILRLHHLVAANLGPEASSASSLFNFSSSDYDMQELMLIADVLVTDYSSIVFDFANLDRPMVFYAYDLDNYRGIERGFYLELDEIAPGCIVSNEPELLRVLRDDVFDPSYKTQHAEAYREFKRRFCSLDDGNCSERVIARLFQ